MALTAPLGACALPVPVMVASWMAEGMVYMASGRTVYDHAVSAVTEKDCRMFRALRDGAVERYCIDEPTLIAAGDSPDRADGSSKDIDLGGAESASDHPGAVAPVTAVAAVDLPSAVVPATAVAVVADTRPLPLPARRPPILAAAEPRRLAAPVPRPARDRLHVLTAWEAPAPRSRPTVELAMR